MPGSGTGQVATTGLDARYRIASKQHIAKLYVLMHVPSSVHGREREQTAAHHMQHNIKGQRGRRQISQGGLCALYRARSLSIQVATCSQLFNQVQQSLAVPPEFCQRQQQRLGVNIGAVQHEMQAALHYEASLKLRHRG